MAATYKYDCERRGFRLEGQEEAVSRAVAKLNRGYTGMTTPFMEPPEPSKSGRTKAERAYRNMCKALEGMEGDELLDLAILITQWREIRFQDKQIVWAVAVDFANQARERERKRQRDAYLDAHHPVISLAGYRRRRKRRATNEATA